MGGERVSDFRRLVHLNPHHHFLDGHHLVNAMVPLVLLLVARHMLLQSEDEAPSHVLCKIAIIEVPVWAIEIFDVLAVAVVQRIL